MRSIQSPRDDPDGLAVEGGGLLVVEPDDLAQPGEQGVGAGEAEAGDDLVADRGVDAGAGDLGHHRADRDLAVALALEHLLEVPEGRAVADLEHGAGGVAQAGDRQLQVDAVALVLEVAALDLELLAEHVDALAEVGRDRGVAASFLMASSTFSSASVGGVGAAGGATPAGVANPGVAPGCWAAGFWARCRGLAAGRREEHEGDDQGGTRRGRMGRIVGMVGSCRLELIQGSVDNARSYR